MTPIGAALLAHIQQRAQTMSTCWLVQQINGVDGSVRATLGFTDHDQAIDGASIATVTATDGSTITGGPAITYDALQGYTRTDIATSSDLSPDNMEVDGVLSSPSITEADLYAGIWDYAYIEMFVVNWADLTMGRMILKTGHLGEVTVERGNFKAELRGLNQGYSRIFGELTSPQCRNNLFDLPRKIGAGCRVDPAAFTFTGVTVDAVGSDNQTIFASALTQPGPGGAVNITAISKANPGRVTLAGAPTPSLPPGAPITIYGCLGMVQVNGDTLFRNPDAGQTHFDLGVDTTLYPTYTGGGKMIPLGSGSGYFDNGVVTWETGANATLAMEVRNSAPGQVVLQLPMPYAIMAGDTFTIRAGCDKSFATCKAKFSNVINFRGEIYLPGTDKVAQVGPPQA